MEYAGKRCTEKYIITKDIFKDSAWEQIFLHQMLMEQITDYKPIYQDKYNIINKTCVASANYFPPR